MTKHIEQMADRMMWDWRQQGQWASAHIWEAKVQVSLYVRSPLDVLQGKVLGEFGYKPNAYCTTVPFSGDLEELHRGLVTAMRQFLDSRSRRFAQAVEGFCADANAIDRIDMLFDDESDPTVSLEFKLNGENPEIRNQVSELLEATTSLINAEALRASLIYMPES